MIATPPMPTPTPRPMDAPDDRPLEIGSATGLEDGSGEEFGDVVSDGGGAVADGGADSTIVAELVVDVEIASVVKLKYCEYALSLRGSVVSSGWKARRKTLISRPKVWSSTVQLKPSFSVSLSAFAGRRQSHDGVQDGDTYYI